jgi:putative membrane protein
MKRIGLLTVACATAVTLACNSTPREDASIETERPDTVGTAGDMAASSGDKAFVEAMAHAGMAEVELGNLAKERAASPEVRQFADMMVRDHTKAGEELTQVATQHAIAMPSQINEDQRELKERLSALRGAEFDREYMQAMVDGHQDVVDRLQTRADEDRFGENKGAVTPERGDNHVEAGLNQWAAATLPTTRHHLDEAKRIHDSLGSTRQTRR